MQMNANLQVNLEGVYAVESSITNQPVTPVGLPCRQQPVGRNAGFSLTMDLGFGGYKWTRG